MRGLRRRRLRRAPAEAHAVADEQLAAERREEDQPLDHADEPRREVGALQRVARVLQPADQERDDERRRTGCSGRAPRRRSRRSRSTAAAARSGRRRACGGSRRPGSRRRGRRARPRSPSPRGSCGACACPRSAPRAASRRAPAPRSRSASASRGTTEHDRDEHGDARRRAAARSPPCRWIVAAGQSAESGSALPVGKTVALKPSVSRKYDSLLKIRYVSTYAGDVVEHQRRDDLVRLEEGSQDARDRAPTRRRRPQPATTIAAITNADGQPLAAEVEAGGRRR